MRGCWAGETQTLSWAHEGDTMRYNAIYAIYKDYDNIINA